MAEDFVTVCVACTKGITREDMKYVDGRAFHNECFEKHGKEFVKIDQDITQEIARIKIDLIKLKNILTNTYESKESIHAGKEKPTTTKRKAKKTTTKRKAKKTTTKRKAKKTTTKRKRR